jgi:hypothetical protein
MAFSTSRRGGEDAGGAWLLFDTAALAGLTLTGFAVAAVWITSRERVRPEAGESIMEAGLRGRSGEGGRELSVGGAERLSLDLGAAFGR